MAHPFRPSKVDKNILLRVGERAASGAPKSFDIKLRGQKKARRVKLSALDRAKAEARALLKLGKNMFK